ncbi:hypothetical protein BXZ70DRAFT_665606 [Cristinia sonorae]|uniref:Uncharacterized protein n=1 Tax=Cristinia sonorae TaxID=1940300 RepID=A0A8K0UUL7_9AGAR|nr:hypothetical protein BXZ70DRAFT_665606 [Cristinia sonorae]
MFVSRWLTPSLKELTAMEYGIEWRRGFLPSTLTKLKIVTLEDSSSSLVREVVDTLRDLPLLEDLTLVNVFHLDHPDPSRPLPQIPLIVCMPHLHSLNLTGSELAVSHFLDHLAFPSSTRVSVQISNDSFSEPSILPVPPLISSLCAKLVTPIDPSDSEREVLQQLMFSSIHVTAVKKDLASRTGVPHLSLDFGATSDAYLIALLEAITIGFPLSGVSTLMITAPFTRRTDTAWKKLALALGNVDSVVFLSTDTNTILNILSPPSNAQFDTQLQSEASPKLPLPRLTSIRVDIIDFNSKLENPSVSFIRDLGSVLKMRQDVGGFRVRVDFRGCRNLPVEELPILLQWAEVSLDGRTQQRLTDKLQ